MPDSITIGYWENIAPAELQQLRLLEPALQKAFEISKAKFDHARWTAKVDTNGSTLFCLERVPNTRGLVTYCTLDELSHLNAKELARHIGGERNSHAEPVSQRPMMFEHLSAAQCGEIIAFRIDITLTVPRAATTLGPPSSYPSSPQMPTHVEVPPLLEVPPEEAVAPIAASSGLDDAWQQFFIAVYRAGGHVYFRECGNDRIEAIIRLLMTSTHPA